MNFYLSDPHFGHANIIKYCNRPFTSLFEMDKTIISNLNSKIMTDDTLYLTGDFSLGSKPHFYTRQINCKNIILILGNHDRLNACKGHFKEIHTSMEIKIGDHKVLLSHYPWKHTADQHSQKFLDRMHDRQKYPYHWLLCGHTHNSKPKLNLENKLINISCEHWDYTPISEQVILDIMNSAP